MDKKAISKKSVIITIVISFIISYFLIIFIANFPSIGYRSITIEGSRSCMGSNGSFIADCSHDGYKAKLYTVFWLPISKNKKEISLTGSSTSTPGRLISPYHALKYDKEIDESTFYIYIFIGSF